MSDRRLVVKDLHSNTTIAEGCIVHHQHLPARLETQQFVLTLDTGYKVSLYLTTKDLSNLFKIE